MGIPLVLAKTRRRGRFWRFYEENAKGIIIACGNTHLSLDYKTVAELLEGLNKNSYELFKTRREMFQ